MLQLASHPSQEHRGLLAIRYPMEHGVVRDWNDMERIWQYIYSKDQLQTFSEEVRQPAPPPCPKFTRLALSLLHFFLPRLPHCLCILLGPAASSCVTHGQQLPGRMFPRTGSLEE